MNRPKMVPYMTQTVRVPKARQLVPRTRVIHALDVEDLDKALTIANAIEPYVDSIKLSYPLILAEGPQAIGAIKEAVKVPILTCFKVADIPEISHRIMKATLDAGADGVTLHGFVGRDTVRECIKVANEYNAQTLVIAEMSHPGAEEFMQPVGEKIAEMAKNLGATGIVAPATRPQRVKRYREIIGRERIIAAPGVGSQGGHVGDAILMGADYEIIGRSIYQAKDPAETAKQIQHQLRSRLEGKRPIPLIQYARHDAV